MSSLSDWYHSLPPVSRTYATICVLTTVASQLGLLHQHWLLLDKALIFKNLQVWRLVTNFFYLGPFSMSFGMQILMILRYSVQLERGPYDKRTADFLWMAFVGMGALVLLGLFVPGLNFGTMGISLVFMLVYLWSREFANARVNIAGVVTLEGFYLPWALLALNTLFGASPWPELLGIFAGHAYYFLHVLYPRQSGRNLLKTPVWVHQLVANWDRAGPQRNTPVGVAPSVPGGPFSGRGHRLRD
eukprot:TRINITY_DN14380_c0_g1_i1.p1 TRINITY_DN14380_c0_g1~~TRINITY_DN14380_c0_g1_i1.p1  ORF type:complete len:244 (+),score=18.27 TRINITY_DN14380_c0_g1_i1:182-913(+)